MRMELIESEVPVSVPAVVSEHNPLPSADSYNPECQALDLPKKTIALLYL